MKAMKIIKNKNTNETKGIRKFKKCLNKTRCINTNTKT